MSERKMSEAQVAAFCLSLPGAREDYKWGGIRVFSVAENKMFAVLDLAGAGRQVGFDGGARGQSQPAVQAPHDHLRAQGHAGFAADGLGQGGLQVIVGHLLQASLRRGGGGLGRPEGRQAQRGGCGGTDEGQTGFHATTVGAGRPG